mgnify:CR=1 FL=1
MNVSLTPELEKVVLEKVACGLYTSASEVIREALRTMVANDRIQQEKLSALRSDIAHGLRDMESGDFEELDGRTSRALLRRINSRRKK